jgi:hypothetical protein
LNRSTPLKRTPFRREGPTAPRQEHPKAKAERCKHCKNALGERERGIHPDCADGWYAANREKIAKKAAAKQAREAKAERAADRAKKQALKKIPKLISEAQHEFNAYIRARDRDKGCFVCLRPFDANIPGRVMHAGHVRSRGAAGHLRFNEDNCLGECEGCNGPHGAKPHQIKAGAIARIGQERYDALEANNEPHKWTREELMWIKTHYRAKAKELERARA